MVVKLHGAFLFYTTFKQINLLFAIICCTFACMKLHIFNPEHDIALASNHEGFTAPHAARQLRGDLGFIPALWADDGDFVLVDDIDQAEEKLRLMGKYRKSLATVEFITRDQLKYQQEFNEEFSVMNTDFRPWGWDMAIAQQMGIERQNFYMLHLDEIRRLSSRKWTAEHLQHDVLFIDDMNVLTAKMSEMRRCVIKSPWSSSGRGVKFQDLDNLPFDAVWASSVIRKQGGIMLEPYYNKVKDFGMEFESRQDGTVVYLGLSLFHTVKGAYTGNVLANEQMKMEMLSQYIDMAQVEDMKKKIIKEVEPALKNIYQGPFGIDLMIVDGHLEIAEMNLRRTMGHVALAISPEVSSPVSVMHVGFDGSHYHLHVNQTLLNAEDTDY